MEDIAKKLIESEISQKRLTMIRKEAKEMLPIIKAFANGETIECRSDINPDKWYEVDKDDDELKFDRPAEFYRIKNKCENRVEQRSSIWERLKICWSVLTKYNYIYFGVSKNPVEWNECGTIYGGLWF